MEPHERSDAYAEEGGGLQERAVKEGEGGGAGHDKGQRQLKEGEEGKGRSGEVRPGTAAAHEACARSRRLSIAPKLLELACV